MTIFSIVTPSYKQLDWLRLCIASVRDQIDESSLIKIEHIVQDAGSPGIEDLAKELGADFYRDGQLVFNYDLFIGNLDPQYRLIIHSESDKGMYDAVNRGYARAQGQLLAYLNCDEQYLPGTLKKVASWFLQHPKKQVLFGDAIVVNAKGDYLCTRKVSVPAKLHTLVSHNLSIFTAATFIRRSVHDQGIQFNIKYKSAGDAIWALDLLNNKISMECFGSCLAAFTDTGQNMSMCQNAIHEKEEMFLRAPRWARVFRHGIVASHRIKRLILQAYDSSPLTYEIYINPTRNERTKFTIARQTHRWPGR